jgi:low affinity Fe/Cu permease
LGHIGSRGSAFSRFARRLSVWTGKPVTFLGASAAVILWAMLGPVFEFSDTWQLVINTSTTIITFLMVFLIQHTQNRDTEAMHLKLDELIRATRDASNALLDLEELDEKALIAFRKRYEELAQRAKHEPHRLPPKPWDKEQPTR